MHGSPTTRLSPTCVGLDRGSYVFLPPALSESQRQVANRLRGGFHAHWGVIREAVILRVAQGVIQRATKFPLLIVAAGPVRGCRLTSGV